MASIIISGSANSKGHFSKSVPFTPASRTQFVRFIVGIKTEGTGREFYIQFDLTRPNFSRKFNESVRDGETIEISGYDWIDLPAGVSHKLSATCRGFSANEAVEIRFTPIEWTTNLQEVSNEVLQSSRIQNPICMGVSERIVEASFANAYWPSDPVVFPITEAPGLELHIEPAYRSNPFTTRVRIDVDKELFRIESALEMEVVKPGSKPESLARLFVNIHATATPVMATSTADTLQLQLASATLDATVVDFELLNQLDPYFGGIAAYNTWKQQTINRIVDQRGQYSTLLPTYVASRPLPDYWDQIEGYEFDFEFFRYRTVRTAEQDVGYLYLVLSVESLMLPLPCHCEDNPLAPQQRTLQRETGTPDEASLQLIEALESSARRKNRRAATPSYRTHPETMFLPMAFSQDALIEIARPHVNLAIADHFSTGGSIYARARYFVKVALENVRVTSNGLSVTADFTAGGFLKAAIRDKCGNEIAASTSIEITYDDTTVSWEVRATQESQERTKFFLMPQADIGIVTVRLKSEASPIDQVASYFTTKLVDLLDESIEREIEKRARVTLFYDTEGNDFLRLDYIDTEYTQNRSIVVIGWPDIRH